ncbi:SDR family oxidoreductase [Nocardia sp. NPDC055049]
MILVTGATGSIGRHLVRLLRQRQAPFKALVRNPVRGRELGGEYVVADFDRPDSLQAAMSGIDRLFLLSAGAEPASGRQPMVAQQVAAIDAAARAGVRTVVKVSVQGASRSGKLASGAHWSIEQHLEASGLDWSILQPSGFMQNFRTGAGTFTAEGDIIGAYGDGRVPYIDCRDIAACAAALLTEYRDSAQRFVLTGSEALSHTDIAARLSAAYGRTISYVDLPPAQLAARLTAQGLPTQFAEDVAELQAGIAEGTAAHITSAVSDLTGRGPRTFGQFLADHQPATAEPH